MVTAEELGQVAELAEDVLTSLFNVGQAAEVYTNSPTPMWAQKLARQILELEADNKRFCFALEDDIGVLLAGVDQNMVPMGKASYPSAHHAIANFVGSFLGDVSVAAVSSDDPDYAQRNRIMNLFVDEEKLMKRAGDVASFVGKNCPNEEVIEHLSRTCFKEMARALQKVPLVAPEVAVQSQQFDAITRALAILASSRNGLTIKQIAAEAGCSPQYLYDPRHQTFRAAWRAYCDIQSASHVLRGRKSRGRKNETIEPR